MFTAIDRLPFGAKNRVQTGSQSVPKEAQSGPECAPIGPNRPQIGPRSARLVPCRPYTQVWPFSACPAWRRMIYHEVHRGHEAAIGGHEDAIGEDMGEVAGHFGAVVCSPRSRAKGSVNVIINKMLTVGGEMSSRIRRCYANRSARRGVAGRPSARRGGWGAVEKLTQNMRNESCKHPAPRVYCPCGGQARGLTHLAAREKGQRSVTTLGACLGLIGIGVVG